MEETKNREGLERALELATDLCAEMVLLRMDGGLDSLGAHMLHETLEKIRFFENQLVFTNETGANNG